MLYLTYLIIELNSKIEFIRVIKGTNYDYFSDEAKKIFLSKEFKISKLSDRMGMRLEGSKLKNVVDTVILPYQFDAMEMRSRGVQKIQITREVVDKGADPVLLFKKQTDVSKKQN